MYGHERIIPKEPAPEDRYLKKMAGIIKSNQVLFLVIDAQDQVLYAGKTRRAF